MCELPPPSSRTASSAPYQIIAPLSLITREYNPSRWSSTNFDFFRTSPWHVGSNPHSVSSLSALTPAQAGVPPPTPSPLQPPNSHATAREWGPSSSTGRASAPGQRTLLTVEFCQHLQLLNGAAPQDSEQPNIDTCEATAAFRPDLSKLIKCCDGVRSVDSMVLCSLSIVKETGGSRNVRSITRIFN